MNQYFMQCQKGFERCSYVYPRGNDFTLKNGGTWTRSLDGYLVEG